MVRPVDGKGAVVKRRQGCQVVACRRNSRRTHIIAPLAVRRLMKACRAWAFRLRQAEMRGKADIAPMTRSGAARRRAGALAQASAAGLQADIGYLVPGDEHYRSRSSACADTPNRNCTQSLDPAGWVRSFFADDDKNGSNLVAAWSTNAPIPAMKRPS